MSQKNGTFSTQTVNLYHRAMSNGLTDGDHELLRSISRGDEAAFLELYRRYQGGVFRFALQMSGKPEIAEEVTQDVFMIVIRSAREYDPKRGSVAAYLYGVARNFVLRRLQQERPYLTALDDPESEHADLAASDQDPLADVTRNERIESLRKAVLALPPAYREVVVLCDLQELDYAETAAILDCAIGTVRSRLHRARALLTEKMRAEERCAV